MTYLNYQKLIIGISLACHDMQKHAKSCEHNMLFLKNFCAIISTVKHNFLENVLIDGTQKFQPVFFFFQKLENKKIHNKKNLL